MTDVSDAKPYGVSLHDDLTRLLRAAPVRTVFDVGAHEGQSLVELSKLFEKATVFSFEPVRSTFAVLCDTARDNARARVFNLALSNESGPRTMHSGRHSCLNSLLTPGAEFAWPTAQLEAPVTVSCDTLDAVAAQLGVDLIDVLKIDVQGAEERVLDGGRRMLSEGRVRSVKLEVLFLALYQSQPTFATLLSLMAGNGFRFMRLYDTFYSSGWLCWADALFVHSSERVGMPLPQLP